MICFNCVLLIQNEQNKTILFKAYEIIGVFEKKKKTLIYFGYLLNYFSLSPNKQ